MEHDDADVEGTSLPSFPGLTFRRFRGSQDFVPMAAVITRSREADGVELTSTPEMLAADYAHPTEFDPASDVLVAEADGRIVGLARMWRTERASGTLAYQHAAELAPEWRRGGLRADLLEYNERHARALAACDRKERPRVLVLWANDEENDWRSLVLRRGYAPVQHEIDLVRSLDDIPEVPLPPGIEVRLATAEDARAVWDARRDASRWMWNYSEDHWGDAQLQAWRQSPEFQPELWQVAWDGATLVGTVLPFILPAENDRYARRRGHTENVYVRDGYRRRGIARALLGRALRVLKERGMDEATLGMEVENPHGPLRLYEGMGFRVVRRFTWYEKPL